MWLRKSSLLGISIAAMFLSTVCLAGEAKEVLRAAHVKVAGPMDRVYEFHQALLKHLGGTLEQVAILCDACASLIAKPLPSAPSTQADYTIYRDNKRLTAFILAWDEIETKAAADVAITFDMNIDEPDCSAMPKPCASAPFCPGPPRGCSKSITPPCARCGPSK